MERHLALRSTCTTDCRRNGERCIGTGIRSRPTPLVLGSIKSLNYRPVDFCAQTSIPSNLCAMTSMMLSTAFRIPLSRSLLLSPSRVCGCWHVTGPDASQTTTIAPLPCVDDVVIRIVDRWQVTSGLFCLSHSPSARQLSRSRSVDTCTTTRELQTHCLV